MKLPTSTTHDIRVTQMTVVPRNEPSFSEMAFTVRIVDEAAGEFVQVQSLSGVPTPNTIAVDKDEWPALRDAIEYMVSQCKDYTK